MKRSLLLTAAVLLLLLHGCSTKLIESGGQTNIQTQTTISSTTVPTQLPPSATPTLTQTPVLPTPTLTSLPTLTSDQATSKLFELLENNGGCRLPCLIGFIPGIITPSEMNHFFWQFVATDTPDLSIDKVYAKDGTSLSFYIRYVSTNLNIGISTYENGNQIRALLLDTFSQPNWDPNYAEKVGYYTLNQILNKYGKPLKVLIWTLRDDRSRPDITTSPFFVSVIYPEKGVYLEYEMERQTRGNNFIGCPSKSFVDVAVWDPEDKEAFEQVVQIMNNGGDLSPYKPLEDATSMTIDEFTETFSNPGTTICLETPIKIWPNP